MPVTLTAAARLREKCLEVKDTILLVDPGFPDKVIRVTPLPQVAVDHRAQLGNENDPRRKAAHVVLNLSNGPEQEVWRAIERDIFLRAPRDKATPIPLQVAPNCREEWNLLPEDVPVVELQVETPPQAPVLPKVEAPSLVERPKAKVQGPVAHACESCNAAFDTAQGLRMHTMKKHKQGA